MTYQLTLQRKPAYLHAVVTGRNTKENVTRYLSEVMRECATHDYRKLLIEERLDGARLGTVDVFDVIKQGSRRFRGMLTAIALVDLNRQGDLMSFAETAAVNRSLPLRVFATVEEAKKWLLREDGKGA